ncbi:hypothetical protein LCGC14_0461840 [marine sediment metagenome]|uniref:Terminase large subunit gp17-like C-terminal domain-containing protein n=1 Tax=marine sediment metagenome TaxID=412755 RepID=A0A0F9V1R7_9ZZZZ
MCEVGQEGEPRIITPWAPQVELPNLGALEDAEVELVQQGLQQELIVLARKDPNVFVALHFMRAQHPMHIEWQDLLSEHSRILIAAPRGCGKSTQISVLRCLWEIGNSLAIRIKEVSVSQTRAKKNLQEIGRHIVECPSGVCQAVFPDMQPDPDKAWSSEQINVLRPKGTLDSRDSTVEAWGVTSSPEGGRADIILYDDITSLQTSVVEERSRDNITNAFEGTWADVKSGPQARFWYICTLWHEDDCSMRVIKNPAWQHRVYGVADDFNSIESWHGSSFDLPIPGGQDWTKEAYEAECQERGVFVFNRSHRNRPMDESVRLFRREFFYGDDNSDGSIVYGISPDDPEFAEYTRYTGVDLGIGLKKTNCPSVIFTVAVADGTGSLPKGTRIPIDIRRGHWTSPNTARQLIDVYETYHPNAVMVENNYYQQALIDWMEDMDGVNLPLEAHRTGSQKMDLNEGIPLLAAEFQRGNWVIPMKFRHPDGCVCPWCVWLYEMVNWYPGSKKTDTVMALWIAQRAIKFRARQAGGFGIWNFG